MAEPKRGRRMDGLGRVGRPCQPLGKRRVSLPLARSPGAARSTQAGEAPGLRSEQGLPEQSRAHPRVCAHTARPRSRPKHMLPGLKEVAFCRLKRVFRSEPLGPVCGALPSECLLARGLQSCVSPPLNPSPQHWAPSPAQRVDAVPPSALLSTSPTSHGSENLSSQQS